MFLEATLAAALLGGVQDAEPQAPLEASTEWEFALEIYGANPPGEGYVLGIFEADRGALHLESRYNYEDLETMSVFAGRRFSREGAVTVSAVPMFGVLFGRTDGVAPGFELDVGWRSLAFSSQSEYAFDFEDHENDFFYTWNELGWIFFDRLELGVATQRTQVFEQDFAVDRGFYVRWTGKTVGVTAYVFNPDRDEAYAALSIDFSF